jgi:glutamine amidotransferase
MARLREFGLAEPVREAALSGRPFLGVCLGLQLLFEHHEEGDTPGLGVLAGTATRFEGDLKVPHMGWNRVYNRPHPMFEGIEKDSYFYYVHSYYVQPGDAGLIVGATEYGTQFCGALARGNLWGTQFHPEKSGDNGLRLLRNFVSLLEAT